LLIFVFLSLTVAYMSKGCSNLGLTDDSSQKQILEALSNLDVNKVDVDYAFSCFNAIIQDQPKIRTIYNKIDEIIYDRVGAKLRELPDGDNEDLINKRVTAVSTYYKTVEHNRMGANIASAQYCATILAKITTADKAYFSFAKTSLVFFDQENGYLVQNEFFPHFIAKSLGESTTEASFTITNLDEYSGKYYCSITKTNSPSSNCESQADDNEWQTSSLKCHCTGLSGKVSVIYVLGFAPIPKENKTESIIVIIILSVVCFLVLIYLLVKIISKCSTLGCWYDTRLSHEQESRLLKEN